MTALESSGEVAHQAVPMEHLKKGAIPIGVMRATAGPIPYVFSCTASKTDKLLDGDGVYMLADATWVENYMPEIASSGFEEEDSEPPAKIKKEVVSKSDTTEDGEA